MQPCRLFLLTLVSGHLGHERGAHEHQPFLSRSTGAFAPVEHREPLVHAAARALGHATGLTGSALIQSDGLRKRQEPQGLPSLAADEPQPIVYRSKDDQLPPVPTSLKCVINLALQYFFVYTFLAVIITYKDLRLSGRTSLVEGLRSAFSHACSTVNAAPMLALLFLVVEMRAAFVGSTHLDDWVEYWMIVATDAIAVQTLMVLLLPAVTGELVECDQDSGHWKNTMLPYSPMAKLVVAIRYLTLFFLYCAICMVMYALLSLNGLNAKDQLNAPAMALPLQCNVNLCVQYFTVALCSVVVRTIADTGVVADPESGRMGKAAAAMQVAFSTVSMAPMLGVVFLLARLRALQLDPVDGTMPSWTNWCFVGATYALLAQTVLVIVCATAGGEVAKSKCEGDFNIINIYQPVYYPLTAARYFAMIIMYASVVGVLFSLAHLKAADAGALEGGVTPAVSVTAHNTYVLATAFFAVYCTQYVLNNLRDVFKHRATEAQNANMVYQRVDQSLHQQAKQNSWIKWIKTAENARYTVQICPMLAILFLAIRARALQVTGGLGGPQPWAQDCMWGCTTAVLVQLLMVVITMLLIDNIPETNRVGTTTSEPSAYWLKVPLTIVRYLAFVVLYGGLVALEVSIFILTPETASSIQ